MEGRSEGPRQRWAFLIILHPAIKTTLGISLRDLPSSIPDVSSITTSIVHHVQTSLSRQAYNLDNLGAYQAAALSAKDNMLVRWPIPITENCSSLPTVELERDSACLHSQATKTGVLPLYRILDGSYLR